MAANFVGSYIVEGEGINSLTLILPAHEIDDFAIVYLRKETVGNTALWTEIASSGWIQLVQIEAIGADSLEAIWYKKLTSSSETNPTFNHVSDSQKSASVHIYRDVDTDTPFDAVSEYTFAETVDDSPTPTPPDITTVTDEATVICFLGVGNHYISEYIPPIGYTLGAFGFGDPYRNRQQATSYNLDVGVSGIISPSDWDNTQSANFGDSRRITIALRPAPPNYILLAEKGSYFISGKNANLFHDQIHKTLTSEKGSYSIGGKNVIISWSGNPAIPLTSTFNTQESTTSTSPVDTSAIIDGVDLEDGVEYIVMYSAGYGGNDASAVPKVTVEFDGTVIARSADEGSSSGIPEASRIHLLQGYYIIVGTGSGTGLRIRMTATGSDTTYVKGGTLVALPLDKLTENTDWFKGVHNSDTAETTATSAYVSVRSETFDLANTGDYLVLASMEGLIPSGGGTSDGEAMQFKIGGVVQKQDMAKEWEDNNAVRNFAYARIHSLSSGNNTFLLEGGTAQGTVTKEFRRSRIIVVDLELFDQYLSASNDSATTTAPTFEISGGELGWDDYLTQAFTPNQEEPVVIIGNVFAWQGQNFRSICARLENLTDATVFNEFTSDDAKDINIDRVPHTVFGLETISTAKTYALQLSNENATTTASNRQHGDLIVLGWTIGGGVPPSAELVVQDSLHDHDVDNVALTQDNTLVTQDSTHSHLADNVALIQSYLLSVNDATHNHTVDGDLVLVQSFTLVVQESNHSHTVDNLALVQDNILAVFDTLHGHTTDVIVLVQDNTVVVNDSLHNHLAESVIITQKNLLVVSDTLHSHSVDNVDLTQKHTLIVDDTLHAHLADNTVLTQSNILTANDSLHSHSVDNIVLEIADSFTLVVQDGLHNHTADNISLVQSNTLIVQNSLHEHLSDNVILSISIVLVVEDSTHSHSTDNITLVQNNTLIVADTLHNHTADNLTLLISITLIVESTLHSHSADNIVLIPEDYIRVYADMELVQIVKNSDIKLISNKVNQSAELVNTILESDINITKVTQQENLELVETIKYLEL